MVFKVFSSDSSLEESLKGIVEVTDSVESYPLSHLLDMSFQKDDFILVSSPLLSTVLRLRDAMKQKVQMTAVVQRKDKLLEASLFPSLRILLSPVDTECFRSEFQREISFRKLTRSLEKQIVGHSMTMERLRSSIILASINQYPVHLSGETGTGKTLAAKLIHRVGNKKRKMVYINCANLQSSLSDSDLFGHMKGSFTNASTSRQGFLERANGSSLFLDEIGDLPEEIQGKLLDTIENGNYRSIGSDEEKKSSFRLITAGQQSLEKLLEMKKLRRDFYFRISNMHIEIEPLRNHPKDIPDIVEHYEEKNHIHDCRIDDYEELMKRDWPGNVRELIHYLDRLHLNHDTRKTEEDED